MNDAKEFLSEVDDWISAPVEIARSWFVGVYSALVTCVETIEAVLNEIQEILLNSKD